MLHREKCFGWGYMDGQGRDFHWCSHVLEVAAPLVIFSIVQNRTEKDRKWDKSDKSLLATDLSGEAEVSVDDG